LSPHPDAATAIDDATNDLRLSFDMRADYTDAGRFGWHGVADGVPVKVR
jgi:hypothetical protein